MNMYYSRQGNSIWEEIKETFKQGSMLTKLIYINLGVFVFVKLAYVVFYLFAPSQPEFIDKSTAFLFRFIIYLELHTVPRDIIRLPWTPFTYMFLHFTFVHIIFNLIGLYLFGRLFLRFFIEKQMLSTYILGGLTGGLVYVLSYNLLPGLKEFDGVVLGASGSIMAIVIATCFYHPDSAVYLPIFGQVKLKYIGIFYLVIDVLLIGSDNNAGGHITHLGGALYGYLFTLQVKKGKDPGRKFSRFMDTLSSIFKRKPKLRVSYRSETKNLGDYEYNKSKADMQKEVDKILDKIAKSGYDSLSKKEKEILFKMSNDK